MNKKYLPSALILYLNYFIHGVGCSILGQAVIKEALAKIMGSTGYGYHSYLCCDLALDVLSHFRLQDHFQISLDAVFQQLSEADHMLFTL